MVDLNHHIAYGLTRLDSLVRFSSLLQRKGRPNGVLELFVCKHPVQNLYTRFALLNRQVIDQEKTHADRVKEQGPEHHRHFGWKIGPITNQVAVGAQNSLSHP